MLFASAFGRRGAACVANLGRTLGTGLLLGGSLWTVSTQASAGEGLASYYGSGFHGRRTASGQRFDQRAMTAAHRTLRFGTRVRVTHARSGRSVIVTINDRGPFVRGRIIDLSRAAANRLGILSAGVAPVRLEVVERGGGAARKSSAPHGTGMRLHELF